MSIPQRSLSARGRRDGNPHGFLYGVFFEIQTGKDRTGATSEECLIYKQSAPAAAHATAGILMCSGIAAASCVVIRCGMRDPFLRCLVVAVGFLFANCSESDVTVGEGPWLHFPGKSGAGEGKHIVFVTGEEYYRSEEGMPMLARILSERHGFDCTVLFAIDPVSGAINPNQVTNIPGLEHLEAADLLVLFTRFRELPDSEMEHFEEFINAGKPVMAFRNATHPFKYPADSASRFATWDFKSKDWPGGFGQQILGDTWVSHHGKFLKEATVAHVNPEQKDHPVLKGVNEEIFARTDVNGVNKLTDKDTVLYYGKVLPGFDRSEAPVTDGRNAAPMPWAWFHRYVSPSGTVGRSFCVTAGSSEDWLEEDLRRLVVNVAYSLTGLEASIPAKSDVRFAGDYEPSATGSLTDEQWAEKNLRPERFAPSTPGR